MGIMILFAFSIPLPTPNMRITTQMQSASACHRLFPPADAIVLKLSVNPSIFSADRVEPVKAPTIYFRIQPMTTV